MYLIMLEKFGKRFKEQAAFARQRGEVTKVRDAVGRRVIHHHVPVATMAGQAGINFAVVSDFESRPIAIHFSQAGKNAEFHRDGLFGA